MTEEEAMELLKYFKNNGFAMLEIKYGNRITANIKLETALDIILNRIKELKAIEEEHRIENGKLREEIEELKNKNMELKDTYIKVARHQEKKGHEELAEYMLAQIEAIPTFTTWEEYYDFIPKQKIKDRIDKITNEINKLKETLKKEYENLENYGTETEIDQSEQYIYNMEQENLKLHYERRALEELLEEE